MFCVFVALGWGYEFSSYQRRGRLVRIQWASDARVILHYAHGLTVEAPLSPSAFANRWFIYYRAGKAKHMIYRDALHPEDYRRLTVYLMWCRS